MPLQKPMRGIREFLGSYQRPTDQFDLFPSILPTVDMADFLQEPEIERGALQINTVGQTVSLVVPEGEIWRTRFLSAESIMAAGETLSLQPVYFNRDRFYVLDQQVSLANVPGQNAGVGLRTADLTLFPGMGIGVSVFAIVAPGNISVTIEVHFQRIFV